MRDELYEVLTAIKLDSDIKGVLLKGNGSKGFCGGADLTEFGTAPSQYIARNIRKERDLWEVFITFPIPIVCVLHGYTFGSGVEIAMLCDLRIATEDTIIGLPETGLGIIPAAGGTQTIPRQIGLGYSLDLLLLGRQVMVDKSLEIGLIDYCVEEKHINEFAYSLLGRLCHNSRELNNLTKSVITQGLELSIVKGLDLEAKKCVEYIIETRQG
tara:strand:- start:617 stop:1255 length:639 start_codon:yes stop_codon:yes gene_type:complete